jgi:hypothetical protein
MARLAGWLVLAALVLSGWACSPTGKSDTHTGGSSGTKPSTSKSEKPPKQDPG